MLTIELICNHAPHKCRCRHNINTQIDRNDLTNQLIKHNPALLKYLARKTQQQINTQYPQTKQQSLALTSQKQQKEEQPYRSIVEEKRLNFCIDDNNISKQPQAPEAQQQQEQKRPQGEENDKRMEGNRNHIAQVIEQRQKPRVKMSEKEKQVKKYHKDLKNQSRYLSDTAFRKYFNRQCFQNYGRQNTQDKNDGFVYGNYMKTFNINPHTGQNIPANEETFYRALVSGSPQKYALYTQEVKLGLTQQATPQVKKDTLKNSKSLGKQKLDVEKMLQDNQQHSRVKHKYEQLHLKKSLSPQSKGIHQERQLKSPSHLEIQTNKHFNKQQRVSFAQPSGAIQQQSNAKESLNPNAQSLYIVQPESQKTFNIHAPEMPKKQTSINQRLQGRQIGSPKPLQCEHTDNQQTIECAACLNKMKKMILDITQKDPQLAERIINSAKKSVLYKNYALNNYQNAAMNPHNYRREDGRLNVYEP